MLILICLTYGVQETSQVGENGNLNWVRTDFFLDTNLHLLKGYDQIIVPKYLIMPIMPVFGKYTPSQHGSKHGDGIVPEPLPPVPGGDALCCNNF